LGTVTQTEQNRESSASSFFYENGETKFRKSKIFCSARWAALLIIQDRLWCGFAQFNLCAHLLDLRGLLFHSRHELRRFSWPLPMEPFTACSQ
jgi:hypothetical protein